jgi:hypothetical protein
MDITMTLMRIAARSLSPISDLPTSVAGADEGARTDNLLRLQAAVGGQLTNHTHAAIAAAVNDLAARLKADAALLRTLQGEMPGTTADEALSVALRICAGCTDGAKAVRETEMVELPGGGRGEQKISQDQRRAYMRYLIVESANDRVYAAGVSIGPLDKRERNKQEPVFDGLSEADLDAAFGEYFRRYPRTR